MKRGRAFPQSHMTYCNKRVLSSFQTKTLPLNPVLQTDAIIVYFDLFLKIGTLLHLTLPLIQTSLLLNED